MTGSPADADDLVQETFARLLERPPARLDLPLRGWLTRVAVNLSRDFLRRRRRAGYSGPWLPGPIETEEASLPAVEPASTEGRYHLIESVSYAFLVALEVLSPQQRAVLILAEVLDYSVDEIAACLELSSGNVKVIHHRARKALARELPEQRPPTREGHARVQAALERFVSKLIERDAAGLEALLAESVRSLSDGGDEFLAAKVPILGPGRVVHFLLRLMELRGPPDAAELRTLNGLPALLATYRPERCHPKEAPRFLLRLELDDTGKIREVHSILATPKLSKIRFPVA
jgi:RNA polymerase sigma-70 factor (ECF subfamily)